MRFRGTLVAIVLIAHPTLASAGILARAISVSGDSISRAFDANTSSCNYGDNVSRNWATGDNHGASYCDAGSGGTFSHAERLECDAAGDVAVFNDAESGATMLGDFASQSTNIRSHLNSVAGPRYALVFMGHNDACTNTLSKTGNGCSGDHDPNNYCRTTDAAFEREFRRGLDQLIQVSGLRLGVLATVRVSELCNFRSKDGCGPTFGANCSTIWGGAGFLEDVFGAGGVCASLTSDCSDQRRIDMYDTLVGYNEVLERVSAEYEAIPTGGQSAGGATKAADVHIKYGAGTFYYKLASNDLSCCDCFHPSDLGQSKLAESVWDGLQCSAANPCCADTASPLNNARCDVNDTSSFYAGGFWPNDIACPNDLIEPGEDCDDGNTSDTDCCTAICTYSPSGAPCNADTNVCTNDVCNATGTCTHPNNTSACNDGNACTQTDQCQSGTCIGSNPVVCSASDQCHTAGTCSPTTGACSNPAKPNGSACTDANACTQADSCQGGACVGSNPVTCSALDQCHDAGTCSPATGACSNPAKPNGTGCTDGSACTQTDACQAGSCVGGNPVVCTASDQCHAAGT
jgi:lysophospholipase L1-like esterase